jgi:hypothetical protein
MNSYLNKFDSKVNSALSNFITKQTVVRGVIHLLLVLYVVRFAHDLPKPVLNTFNNSFFKLFVFSLVMWTAQFSPSTSIMISLGFLVTMNIITKNKMWEMLDNVESVGIDNFATFTKDDAVNTASSIIDNQLLSPPVINTVAQQNNTTVIQPTIVNTTQGPTVVNPSVVIAPAVISTSNGDKMVINPDVTVISPKTSSEEPTFRVNPIRPSTPDVSIDPVDPIVTAGPVDPPESGCLPMRNVDMSQVVGFEQDLLVGIFEN